MALCKNCGVDLDENMNYCPLCGSPVLEAKTENKDYIKLEKSEQDKKLISEYKKLNQFQKRKLFWELSAIILVSGMIGTLIIDLYINKNITWSKYVFTICLVVLANISLISFLQKRIFLILTGSFLSLSVMVVLFGFFNDKFDYGVILGIPLLFAALLIAIGLITVIRISGQRGLNIIAYIFIAIGLLFICIDGAISFYIHDSLKLYWSIIVSASIVPVVAILMFIHYRLKKGTDLKKFFNI